MRTTSPIAEIKSAKKRSLTMGVYSPWRAAFDKHPLAAMMDNYTVCIDVELAERRPDYECVLHWILTMARAINAYCDATKIAGDDAAEYWLERFLWRCDRVCQWDFLHG